MKVWCSKYNLPIDEVGSLCSEECIGEGQDDCEFLVVSGSTEDVAMKLIEALRMSVNTNDFFFIVDFVEAAIKQLDLPVMSCERCGKEMDFYKYHWNQGLCDSCTSATLIECSDEE